MSRYRAKAGLRIPMPGQPGQFIPDSGDGISVDEQSAFYRRLIDDGDLVEVPDTTPAPAAKNEGKK